MAKRPVRTRRAVNDGVRIGTWKPAETVPNRIKADYGSEGWGVRVPLGGLAVTAMIYGGCVRTATRPAQARQPERRDSQLPNCIAGRSVVATWRLCGPTTEPQSITCWPCRRSTKIE